MRRSYLLSAAALSALFACREGKDVDGDCGTVSGGISNPDYEFKEGNFSCESNPISTGFSLSADSFDAYGGLDTWTVIEDFEEATDAWSTTGAALTIDTATHGLLAAEVDANDGEYHVFMWDDRDDYDEGETGLARAFLWSEDGEAFDCDIVVFAEDHLYNAINWKAGGAPASNQYDLAYAFTHELGHCVGIADQTAPSTISDIMYESVSPGIDFDELAEDEVEAAIYLYGEL